jgi:hypothetical protein
MEVLNIFKNKICGKVGNSNTDYQTIGLRRSTWLQDRRLFGVRLLVTLTL